MASAGTHRPDAFTHVTHEVPTVPGSRPARRHGAWALALALAALFSANCAPRRATVQALGIPSCPAGADRDVLAADALQCWFTGAHGRWRVLGHQSHLDALVVDVEARDLRDAEPIAKQVVAGGVSDVYAEVLVYVQAEDAPRVSRVRWTARTGFETLEFSRPEGTALRSSSPARSSYFQGVRSGERSGDAFAGPQEAIQARE